MNLRPSADWSILALNATFPYVGSGADETDFEFAPHFNRQWVFLDYVVSRKDADPRT